jgi:hypothetical protein
VLAESDGSVQGCEERRAGACERGRIHVLQHDKWADPSANQGDLRVYLAHWSAGGSAGVHEDERHVSSFIWSAFVHEPVLAQLADEE